MQKELIPMKGRHSAETTSHINHRNGASTAIVCSTNGNGEGPQKKETLIMKMSSGASRLMKKLRREAKLSLPQAQPSAEQVTQVERKILAEESLAKSDIASVMAILKQFSKSARIVRSLAKTAQPASALAVQCLVKTTTENARCLDELPAKKLRFFAAARTEFPMLFSLRLTSKERMNKRAAEIKLGEEVAPGYTVNARWKKDDFAAIAEEMLLDLFGGPLPHLTLPQWDELWPHLLPEVTRYLKQQPSLLKDLQEQAATPSDNTKGRRQARVVENIQHRMRALVGVKGLR